MTATRAGRPVQESATARLSRLLTMVPWLLARQGVDVDVAAAQFGVSREQLESDLALLFVCGTPGHLPDDLIEADWEDGQIYVGNADAISRPLRFTVDEALTLMVGLRALAATPGVTGASGADGGEAILRALTKLEQATGEAAGVAARVRVTLDDGAAETILADASRAVQERRRVRLSYQSFGRDEVTEREVDPMRVTSLDAVGISRGGATGPRTCGCSAWIGCNRCRSSTSTGPRRSRPNCVTLPARPINPRRTTCSSSCSSSRRPRGSPTTTPWTP